MSAQQARERKKQHLNIIEGHTKEMENRCAVLEQRVLTLERENFMLRQVCDLPAWRARQLRRIPLLSFGSSAAAFSLHNAGVSKLVGWYLLVPRMAPPPVSYVMHTAFVRDSHGI